MISARDMINPQGSEPRRQLVTDLPVEERWLEFQAITTPVLEGGVGPPIVLLHGPGEHAPKWRRIVPDLVRTHRVIAPDLPGHGASRVNGSNLDGDRVLAWVGDLIDATCDEPPILLGQIVGGGLAAHFAATSDVSLRQLVLSDSLGLAPFQPDPAFGEALGIWTTDPNEQTHDVLWEHCAFDLDGLRDDMGRTWEHLKAYNLESIRTPGVGEAMHALMAAFGFSAVPDELLRRLPTDTTLIWGRNDLATPLEVAEAANARYGWPLYVIDDCADDPPIERPDEFLATLRMVMDAASTPQEVAR